MGLSCLCLGVPPDFLGFFDYTVFQLKCEQRRSYKNERSALSGPGYERSHACGFEALLKTPCFIVLAFTVISSFMSRITKKCLLGYFGQSDFLHCNFSSCRELRKVQVPSFVAF